MTPVAGAPLGFSSPVVEEMNSMNLIWAFEFKKFKDPATKQDKVYDLHDFVGLGSPSLMKTRVG